MRQAPFISVITITLNDLAGLKYTVDSVESQTYSNYEHIVVDGKSSDGTVDFCAATEKRRTNFLYTSEKDGGIFDAMNKGARMARGDLLVFVNSSDGMTDSSVLDFVAERWSDPEEWQWGYGAMRFTDSNRVPFSGTVQAPFSRRKFELGRQYIPHPASYVGRAFFLAHGGSTSHSAPQRIKSSSCASAGHTLRQYGSDSSQISWLVASTARNRSGT